MGLSLPWTLWRMCLGELWRLALLTVAVMVVVLSFALTVKFFAEGRLGVLDALPFMAWAAVPMLQYALPFAGGFATTLTYHRMTGDNEMLAAHAGGISRARLLAPALAMGVGLALALSVLVEQVAPRFLLSMQDLVGQGVAKVIVGAVERGEAIEHANVLVYADEVRRLSRGEGAPSDGPGQERLALLGVVVARLAPDGTVESEAAARRAWVSLDSGARDPSGLSGDDGTRVTVTLEDLIGTVEGSRVEQREQTLSWTVPSVLDDDPKYLTAGQLARARANPDAAFNFIDSRRRDLAFHLGEREVTSALSASLEGERRVSLLAPDGRTVVVRASGIRWTNGRWELLPARAGEPIRVERVGVTPSGQADPENVTVFTAASGGLRTDMGVDGSRSSIPGGGQPSAGRGLSIWLELEQVRVTSQTGPSTEGVSGELERHRMGGLLPAGGNDVMPGLLSKSSAELLALAEPRVAAGDAFLAGPTKELRRRLDRLDREIVSKRHERVAVAASCLVMVLTGAVTAIRLAGALPLVVYLWSFLPALGALLTISVGQEMAHQGGAAGLVVLWGGVAGLLAYSLVVLWLLRRH